MRREECVELFKRIPETSHAQVNLVLRNQFTLSVDVVARFEPTFLVFRGREGGTTDEGRAFFVPYEEIAYVRLERVVRLGELKQMFGETGYVDAEDRLSAGAQPDPRAEPKLPAADLLNASLKASKLPHLALMASASLPVGAPPALGARLFL